jgi:cytochrome P450
LCKRANLAPDDLRKRDVSAIDLLDLSTFVASDEHVAFRALRDDNPVAFNPEPGGPGFWSLTRYDHVSAVARDHNRFLSGRGTQIKDRRAEGHGHPSVHNSDPPLHGQLRNIVLPALTRAAVQKREERLRRIVDDLIDAAPRGPAFDFVDWIAIKLPMMVIADVLGVPPEDSPKLVDWANLMSDVRADCAAQEEARASLFAYFRHLAAAKRVAPGDDVASELVAARLDGKPLEEQVLDAYFILLTVAGNETTRFLLTGGLAQLLRQPDQLAKLRADPALIGPMIEELCRFVSPVTHMRRTAAHNLDLFGTHVPAGGKVVLWFASANRDERRFVEPQRLDIARSPNPHVGFGMGAHFCVGAHLARLETRLFFEAFLARGLTMELLVEPERLPSNWFTGWTSMKVRWS